jgi:hypothetical protein
MVFFYEDGKCNAMLGVQSKWASEIKRKRKISVEKKGNSQIERKWAEGRSENKRRTSIEFKRVLRFAGAHRDIGMHFLHGRDFCMCVCVSTWATKDPARHLREENDKSEKKRKKWSFLFFFSSRRSNRKTGTELCSCVQFPPLLSARVSKQTQSARLTHSHNKRRWAALANVHLQLLCICAIRSKKTRTNGERERICDGFFFSFNRTDISQSVDAKMMIKLYTPKREKKK